MTNAIEQPEPVTGPRSIREIIADLSKPLPARHLKTRRQGGTELTYVERTFVQILKNHGSFNPEGLKILREVLRDISFRLHNRSFMSAIRGDAVWIYLVRARHGTQETESSAKATLEILHDAMSMERNAFRERL